MQRRAKSAGAKWYTPAANPGRSPQTTYVSIGYSPPADAAARKATSPAPAKVRVLIRPAAKNSNAARVVRSNAWPALAVGTVAATASRAGMASGATAVGRGRGGSALYRLY